MTSRHFALLVILAGALIGPAAQAQTPLPPSIAAEQGGAAAPARKPATKPRPKPAKPAEGSAPTAATAKPAAKPAAAQRGYSETLPLPRRIDRDDIADPYGSAGGGGSRMRPVMTPSGRPGMGGSF